jgi:hypothetical protein
MRASGKFRWTLYGPSGEVKQQSIGDKDGWSTNLITDKGLQNLTLAGSGGGNWSEYLILGDGNVAPAVGDTAISGTLLGYEKVPTSNVIGYPSGPNYERVYQQTYTFATGEATGTIRELALGNDQTGATEVAVRHLVSPEIVKGALDELTVEYHFTAWPDLTDSTGTITISGTSYDYVCRMLNVTEEQGVMPGFGFWSGDWGVAQAGTGTLSALTAEEIGGSLYNEDSVSGSTYGGSPGSYYAENNCSWGIDNLGNGSTFTVFCFDTNALNYSIRDITNRYLAYQFSIDKTVGGGGLLKENTHELTLGLRITSDRYP